MADASPAGGRGFQTEIRKMMYVFGDRHQPSLESAALVEDITRQQIIQLVVKAGESAGMREGQGDITVEDVLFLMRKDKEKVKRILYQIQFKAMARRSSSGRGEEPLSEGDQTSLATFSGKKMNLSLDFLSDHTGVDVLDMEDANEIQHERLEIGMAYINSMQRLDSITRNMDPAEYATYVECRQTSFNKNMAKLREWLDLQSVVGQKPSSDVMEVLGYLAYNTVRELVELSLLVKEDMERSHREIISTHHLTFPPSSPHTPPNIHPPHSPPPTSPTSPSKPTSPGTSQHNSESTRSRNPRGRKRRRNGTETATTSAQESTSEQLNRSGPDVGSEFTGRGIQPVHIREAIRRLSVPCGPLIPLATHHIKPSFTQTTLCF